MLVSEKTVEFNQSANETKLLNRRSGDNPFEEFERIELAVETIRSKVLNSLNATDETLLAVQNSMDVFESDFDAKVRKIQDVIANEVEAGRVKKSDRLTQQFPLFTSQNYVIAENLFGDMEDKFSAVNDESDESHFTRMGTVVDRVHDVRLTKLEFVIKKIRWCLLEAKRSITETILQIVFRTIATQTISYDKFICLKDIIDHLKPVGIDQEDTVRCLPQTKTKQLKKLCGSLRNKIRRFFSAVNFRESSVSPSTVLRIKKIEVPRVFLSDQN